MGESDFSVLMSVYEGDTPEHFQTALESVFEQTVEPTEVVVVTDGPLTAELEGVLESFEQKYPEQLTVHSVSENQGLGVALREGVKACSYDLVARMDADDISVPNRFEQQLAYLEANPEVDVVGGHVGEFTDDPDRIEQIREVPTTREAVRAKSRFRCPANHPTVMFRRDSVLCAGNYRSYRSMQDYELWMRMLSQGYEIANLDTVLVKFRTEGSLDERRGGWDYAKTELSIFREFYRMGAISLPVLLVNIGIRLPVRLLPDPVRALVYKHILRS